MARKFNINNICPICGNNTRINKDWKHSYRCLCCRNKIVTVVKEKGGKKFYSLAEAEEADGNTGGFNNLWQ